MSKRAIFRAGRAAPQARSELAAALSACRRALIALGLASALVNILYLTGSLYMLEVYDRVLPSRSIATLIGLSVLVLFRTLATSDFDFAKRLSRPLPDLCDVN